MSPAPALVLGRALARAMGHRSFRQPAPPRTALRRRSPQVALRQPERQEGSRRGAPRLWRRPAARVRRRLLVSPDPALVLRQEMARAMGHRAFPRLAQPRTALRRRSLQVAPQQPERQEGSRRAAPRLWRRPTRVRRRLLVSPDPALALRQEVARVPGRRPFRQLAPPGAALEPDLGADHRSAGRAGVSGRSSPSPAARRPGCPVRPERPGGLPPVPVPGRPGSAPAVGSPR